jgi:hypothetical protein
MKLLTDLRTILVAETSVANVTANNPVSNDKCIRPERRFQGDQLPALLLGLHKSNPLPTLTGHRRTYAAEVVVTTVGRTSIEASELADKALFFLESFQGATAGGKVDAVILGDSSSDFVQYDDGSDGGEYFVDSLITVHYKQA